jgi:hypothetical protein
MLLLINGRHVSAARSPIGLLLSGGTFLILTDTMSSETFLDYGWRIPYSEFVIGSCRFLYPIKITELLLSKIKKKKSESSFYFVVKFL